MKILFGINTSRAWIVVLAVIFCAAAFAQDVDVNRLRELREKARSGSLTAAEKVELDKGMAAYQARRPTKAAPSSATEKAAAERKAMAAERQAQFDERQTGSFERMREQEKEALAVAAKRSAPAGPPREYFVNNETGDDRANGGADGPVKTLAKAVSFLKPGDTLHLAVTSRPYRETLTLPDNFGGTPGKPVTIDGHGATITGSDPLRLDGWTEAGTPGLYKSAKLLSELDEFGDDAKLMRVYFIFDGVLQHMGRSSKGSKAPFKAPASLQPGEWSYVSAEKTFYLRVDGRLADAKVEVPYRRNGVAVRSPKAAVTHVAVKNLVVCHVLNDGFNLHGTTRDLLLQNIAAYECGDDGISPHETCEVTIDGFWSVGNSTGMGNGYLSVTRARNVRLEGNLAHQLMTAHAPVTELRDSIIIAPAGTQPVNISNSQDTRLKMDNVQISSPAGQKAQVVAKSTIEGRRLTVVGPAWENAGTMRVTESAFGGGSVISLDGGTWEGSRNVYDPAMAIPTGDASVMRQPVTARMLDSTSRPFADAGASAGEFRIPPRSVPHPGAGKFPTLTR